MKLKNIVTIFSKPIHVSTLAPSQGTVTTTPATSPRVSSNTSPSVELEPTSDGNTVDIITSNSIYKERLRQARASFNLAFGLTAVSAIIGFSGVLLMFSGNVSAGTVTTAGAATSGTVSASWLKLAKDANDRLDEAAKALEDES